MSGSGHEDCVFLGWGSYLYLLFFDNTLLDKQLTLFKIELAIGCCNWLFLNITSLYRHGGFRLFLCVEFYDVDISTLIRLTNRVDSRQIGEVVSDTLQ